MDKRSKPQPVIKADEAAFKAAYAAANNATNIYGWHGETPPAGYYQQGGTLIEIFARPDDGVIGVSVPA